MHFWSLLAKYWHLRPIWSHGWPINNANKVPRWFSVIWVPKLLLPPVKIMTLGPKTAKFGPKYAFLGTYRPCRFIWCGARALSRKTPIYFIYMSDLWDRSKLTKSSIFFNCVIILCFQIFCCPWTVKIALWQCLISSKTNLPYPPNLGFWMIKEQAVFNSSPIISRWR